jgi:hypothetical protein
MLTYFTTVLDESLFPLVGKDFPRGLVLLFRRRVTTL